MSELKDADLDGLDDRRLIGRERRRPRRGLVLSASFYRLTFRILGKTRPFSIGVAARNSHELARTYQADGRVKEAIEQLKRIMAIRKTTQADPFLSTAAQYIFAKAYRAGGRAKEAIKPLERVLALSRNGTPQQWSNKEADGVTPACGARS
ncbi:hypothetical protein E4U57_001595 [Claviceps arundinis]|uniref:Tetratricopeptide repeat protein n=1 Tax=Claviceps arundinis TaxID=1623583 RepID=A0ABQ7PKW1_9HYPO|nr:hypothetical protein E4U57_001595 [Claviceps arundinis]